MTVNPKKTPTRVPVSRGAVTRPIIEVELEYDPNDFAGSPSADVSKNGSANIAATKSRKAKPARKRKS